jgi:hypothetical protein
VPPIIEIACQHTFIKGIVSVMDYFYLKSMCCAKNLEKVAQDKCAGTLTNCYVN